MDSKRKTWIGLAIFVLFLIGSYFAYTALSGAIRPTVSTTSAPSAKAVAAPDFTVTDAKGKQVKLSDFIGKPVVLNFWASWCPPCKSEMPHFNKAYAEYKDSVVFMMVDLVDGQRETQAKGQQYVDSQNFKFPVYFDLKQDAADAYSITSIPTTVFIDAAGKVVTGYQGAIDEKTLVAAIELIRK